MAPLNRHTATTADVPHPRLFIGAAGQTVLPAPVELTRRDFTLVALEGADALTRIANIPDLTGAVERPGENESALRVEGEGDDLRGVAVQGRGLRYV